MGDTWWSTAPVHHLANGQLRKQAKAPHGVSLQQCFRCCKLWHLSLLIHGCVGSQTTRMLPAHCKLAVRNLSYNYALAMKVFSLSLQYHIRLEPEWILRELNERADTLSRIVDYDDWFLNPTVFSELDTMWGPHSVDHFACFHNSQLPRFDSHCWNPGSEAVDAFTVNWASENNWWCPPISLVPRVIRHAQVCGARGTLVVPCWPSVPFWPLLCPAEGQLAHPLSRLHVSCPV